MAYPTWLLALSLVISFGFKDARAATLEELSVTVAYLKEGNNYGTGFCVANEHPGAGSKEQPYLVTASHVAKFLMPDSSVTFRDSGDIPLPTIVKEIALSGSMAIWHFHRDADVAVLRLKVDEGSRALLKGRCLKLSSIAPDESSLRRERPVVVMGFPLALGTTGHFSPLTSEAKPASGLVRLLSTDFPKEATYFVLDKPSIGGFSGAPVFLSPGPYASGGAMVFLETPVPTVVVGLVHGTVSDKTGGKLAAVVPSKFIRDTILQASNPSSGTP